MLIIGSDKETALIPSAPPQFRFCTLTECKELYIFYARQRDTFIKFSCSLDNTDKKNEFPTTKRAGEGVDWTNYLSEIIEAHVTHFNSNTHFSNEMLET